MIVISDLHIGREDCQIDEVVRFIHDNPTEKLILNGDIFDQFAIFDKAGKWREHRQKVKVTWQLLRKRKTKIIYLVGNHDYLMLFLIPFGFLFGIKIRKRVVIGDYLIEHGDWITYYLKMRFLKTGDYRENCELFATIKEKILIVGHTHKPYRAGRVIDVGEWVGHGTYLEL